MTRLSVHVVVALVAASSLAAAQHARYTRDQPAPAPVVLSERVKPKPVTAAGPAAAKPSIDADAVLSIDSLRGGVRTEQEQILADLIANTADSEVEEKSDYYFRLGELYANQHLMWRRKSAELAAATNAEQRKQATMALERAKQYLLKTVKVYKGLTDNEAFRNYPKLDVALFYYAYTLQGGKYMKEARQVYDKLLKNFPNSKYVPEAHLAFADYYFEQGQFADAEARYKQVLKFPKSSVYAYALYKLGWVDLNLSHSQQAAEAFHQVVIATRSQPKQAELHRAARADFARAFGQLDKTTAAKLSAFFDNACERQYQVALASRSVKDIEALVRTYKSQQQPDDDCRANAAAMSSELAAAAYAEWAQTQNADSLAQAEQLYAIHLGAFPGAAEPRAQYAEVLWTRADREPDPKLRSERWTRAADAFATIKTTEATRATALAWMNALDAVAPAATKLVLGKPPRSHPRALPIKRNDAKLVAAIKAYTAQSPDPDEELAQMRLVLAAVLRGYRHFEEAATVLDEFLQHHADDPRAEFAANLMLDSLMQAGMIDELVEVAAAITADEGFVDGKPQLQQNLLLVRTRAKTHLNASRTSR
jgi:TolA-binding protein